MTRSVIVVSHRPHRWLVECLASVTGQAEEVVVVDNGSADDSVGTIARAAGARVVRLPTNVGFPAGVNAGVAAATGDVVALLNDDAMADPGWLDSAERVLTNDPTVAVVAPKMVFALPYAVVRFDDEPRRIGNDERPLGRALRSVTVGGVDVLARLVGPGVYGREDGELDGRAGPWRWTAAGSPIYVPLGPGIDDGVDADVLIDGEPAPVAGLAQLINNAGSYLSIEGWGGDYGYLAPDDGRFDTTAERFGACGGALVTRAETLARVGPLASSFFAYYEDVDWCWRARLAGLRAIYEPAGVIRHVGGVTSGGPLAVEVRDLAARNRLRCLARNAPGGVAVSQIRKAMIDTPAPEVRRAFPQLLSSLVSRAPWSRSARQARDEVWERWAGVDETW